MNLRPTQLIGYATGDAGNNLAFSMASMFLLLYYTDVAGITAAAAGTIFLVVRVWDGLGDLIAGRLVDRTNTRWGKFRPWLLFGSVPLLLLSVLTFRVPDTSMGLKLLYAYLTYGALAFVYSLVNIPYGSLAAAMTQDSNERAKLGSARSMGAAATILLLAFVVAPQIQNSPDLQRSLTLTTGAFVVVGFLLYLTTFLTARENVERDVAVVGLRESLQTLKRNRALVTLCISAVIFLTGMFALQTIGIYYARDVLGNANLFIAITAAQIGLMFVAAPLVPRLARRFGKRRVYMAGGVVGAVGAAIVFFAPATVPAIAIGGFVVIGGALAIVNILMWALEADTVEYGEWQTGIRTEGTTYAAFSFTRKVGQALGGAAAAYTIAAFGYVAGSEAQSSAAIFGIRAAAGLVPIVTFLLAAAVMLRYDLTEERHAEIVAEIRDRRLTRAAAPASAAEPA
jgi:glucuronide carrier protein